MSDTIYRQAAIRWVKTECNPYGNPTLDYETGIKVINHLMDMPSAEPERKNGKWIDCRSSEHWKCSECEERAPMYWDSENMSYSEWISPFCPNCGADMRGEE